jgi:cold shock CspA family protein
LGTPLDEAGAALVQGVIKSYDPISGDGVVVRDTDFAEFDIAAGALAGSIIRMLRQGQRVVFEVDESGRAGTVRFGSEADMGTPGFPPVGSETLV